MRKFLFANSESNFFVINYHQLRSKTREQRRKFKLYVSQKQIKNAILTNSKTNVLAGLIRHGYTVWSHEHL